MKFYNHFLPSALPRATIWTQAPDSKWFTTQPSSRKVLPDFFSCENFPDTDGAPDVAEPRVEGVRVLGVRAEGMADLVRQRGAVHFGRSTLVRNVQNRPDGLIRAGTGNGVIWRPEVKFVLIPDVLLDPEEVGHNFSGLDVGLREQTLPGTGDEWLADFNVSGRAKGEDYKLEHLSGCQGEEASLVAEVVMAFIGPTNNSLQYLDEKRLKNYCR